MKLTRIDNSSFILGRRGNCEKKTISSHFETRQYQPMRKAPITTDQKSPNISQSEKPQHQLIRKAPISANQKSPFILHNHTELSNK